MAQRRFLRWQIGALLGILLGCGPAPEPVETPAKGPIGQAGAVRAEFEEICRRLKASDERFYGEKPLHDLEAKLAGNDLDAEQRMVAQALLGRELLEWGRPEEAIDILQQAREGAAALGVSGTFPLEILGTQAAAHLQAAEDANCILLHTTASCLLPVEPSAVHALPEHARQAGDLYAEFLRQVPGSAVAAWLLNLSRMVSGDSPQGVPTAARLPPDALVSPVPFPRWRDRGPELGINVVDLAGGAVLDDFDGDGHLDLITSTADPCDSLKAFRGDGRGGFENVTARWGLDEQLGGLNLIHGDYDGDGRLDLLVLRGAWMFEHGHIRNSLLHNELGTRGELGPGDSPGRAGRFEDHTRQAGLAEPAWPTQTAAWADFDGDGDLDLYVGNEGQPPDFSPSNLFRNRGDGTFEDIAEAAGVTNHRFAKAVTWGDYDDDGDPDLYVSNIGPNRLYRNDGDRFTDVAPELNVTAPEGKSFATWFFDFDNDGDLDLFVADYDGPVEKVARAAFGLPTAGGHPLLYRNEGGRFREVSEELGLDQPILPMGANYGDLDNDGWLDFYLGTGDPEFESLMPNRMFRNAQGRRFEDVTFAGGFGHLQKGHGVAFGDVDGDGDQDLLHQLGGFFPGDAYGNALLENPTRGRSWITLRLVGTKANRFAVGARIEVRLRTAFGPRSIHLLAGSGGSFGGSSLQQEIGLGDDAQAIEEILIRWPGSGTLQTLTAPPMNRVLQVEEKAQDGA